MRSAALPRFSSKIPGFILFSILWQAGKAHSEQRLVVICAGAVPAGYPKEPGSRYMIDDGIPDYDDVPPWYEGDAAIAQRNAQLKERMRHAQEKRQRRQQGQTADPSRD